MLIQPAVGALSMACHQSTFDLRDPRPSDLRTGRAALTIAADADGNLDATGYFASAPGPGYWSRP